ncbi:RAD55 family ATPase [Salinibaculum rarum]|uniref:RAD55 family ATPase n=1 Tax=Salinibaculum rarum TaxID=3058903 RepID=UPI0026604D66|nr:ATPase domain-containing protein [Salinibaculum sp. KK48]
MPSHRSPHDTVLSTGISDLDEHLAGGIPSGSVVVLKTESDSQSELLFYSLVAERETLYISTIRNERVVRATFETVGIDFDALVTYTPPGTAIEEISEIACNAEGQTNIVVDSVGMLESADREEYQEFLNDVQNHVREIGGVVLLHCHKERSPDNREITTTAADIILDVESHVEGTAVEHFIHVPKYRGGRAFSKRIKVEFSDSVTIDTGRDIA